MPRSRVVDRSGIQINIPELVAEVATAVDTLDEVFWRRGAPCEPAPLALAIASTSQRTETR